MVQAAALVEGEHDFTSFAAVDPEKRKQTFAIDKGRSATKALDTKSGIKTKPGLTENTADETKSGIDSDADVDTKPEAVTNAEVETNHSTFEIDQAEFEAELEPNNVRTIFHSQWQRQGDELIYTVRGNGFLHHMVRNLVGTFLMVGKGSLTVPTFDAFLNCVTAPPPQPPPPPADFFWSASSTSIHHVGTETLKTLRGSYTDKR